jgi:NADP-dependent 3-hydroxy acid dehydrogenase YdfG
MQTNTPLGAAIVTGASRGLGAGIADSLARAGHPVVLAARDVERLRGTASAIAALGPEVVDVAADVTDEVQVERLVGIARDRLALSTWSSTMPVRCRWCARWTS